MQLILESMDELNAMIIALGFTKGSPADITVAVPTAPTAAAAAATVALTPAQKAAATRKANAAKAAELTTAAVANTETLVSAAAPVAAAASVAAAPVVTMDELITFVKANFADNMQPVVDMLARVGCEGQRVSTIPPELIGKALEILQGA